MTTDLLLQPLSHRPLDRRGSVTFIGTATVLVRLGTFTFLTDPNFLHAGDHAHLGYGLRSQRLTDPALELSELPPLDFVLLSHHHGDHFDHVVERLLDGGDRVVRRVATHAHHDGATRGAVVLRIRDVIRELELGHQ